MVHIILLINFCFVLYHCPINAVKTSLVNDGSLMSQNTVNSRIFDSDESNIFGNTKQKVAGKILDSFFDDPDINTNISGLITNKGYPVEEHTVLTADGYLLSLLRIPYGRNERNLRKRNKDSVLLLHGVLGDATNFVLNFPNQSLGFILPDEGYDVWLLSTRGTTYSKRHIRYTINQFKFWDFSFDEIAQFDIPATIDYILQATGKKDLYLIGHSQGTTATFAMLSELPHYNDKIKLFIALAPATFFGFVTTAARVLVPFSDQITAAVNIISSGNFLPNNNVTKAIRTKVCGRISPDFCISLLFAAGGADRSQFNETRTGVYFAHFPAGTSVKSLYHFAQLVRSRKFRKFDYYLSNLIYYNQIEPPDYNLSRITTPIALFSSTNDLLADPQDVEILREHLNTIVFDYLVPYPYNHFDFVIGLNAAKLIYEPVLQLLLQY